VVDCLEAANARPGRVRVLPFDAVAGSARLVGSHDIGLAAAVELGRLLGIDMPVEVEVIGIEAKVGDRIEEGLSPEVAAAVPLVASWLHGRLGGKHGATYMNASGMRVQAASATSASRPSTPVRRSAKAKA
jgi:hydrogenase maturation protease